MASNSGPHTRDDTMRLIPGKALVAVIVSSLVLSCTDGNSLADLDSGDGATVALAILPSFPASLLQSDAAPINRIRITVLAAPGDAVVTVHVEDVDPNAPTGWEVTVEVPIPPGGSISVRLLIELINVSQAGVETVEFTALTGVISLVLGQAADVAEVSLERGPPDNLAVTALSIADPGPVIEGDVVQLDVSVTTDDPNANPTLFWSSLNESLATVDDNGVVITLLPGEVGIVVTAGSESATLPMVILRRIVGISVNPESLVLEHVGAEGTLTSTVVDPRGDPVEAAVEWSVGDPAVLQDLGGGKVLALAPGSTDVTATVASDPSLSASATVLVELIPVGVNVTPEVAAATAFGQQVQFSAVVTDLQGSVITGVAVSWRSNAESVATVDASGKATAVGVGEAGIFADVETGRGASAGSDGQTVVIISGSALLVVTQVVASVQVTPAELTLDAVGASSTLFATALDAGGTSVSGATFVWASSNTGVAVVSATGTVTATGVGTATITATSEGVSGFATVEVIVSLPVDRSYTTAGNTQLLVGAFPLPPTAVAKNASNLLATTPGLTVTSLGPFATVNGGSVTIEPDGDFLYTPLLGDNTTDSFQYTVASGAMATVTISIVDMVWYINNLAGFGNGTGASDDPFGSFDEPGLDIDPAPGHTFFIHTGDGTTLNYDSDAILNDNDKVLGEGVGLTVAGVGTIVPAGTPPRVTNTLGDFFTLASGNTVAGLTIDAPLGAAIAGGEISGGTVDQINILNPGGAGIDLIFASGTFTFSSVDVQGAGSYGVNIQSSGGTFTFTDLSIAGGSDDAFRVTGGSPTVDVNVSAAGISNVTAFKRALFIQSTTGGTVTFNGGSITDTGGSGIDIFSTAGAITVNTPVTIDDPSGSGVEIISATGPVTFADLDVTIPPPALALTASRAPAFQPVQNPVPARLGGPTGGVAIDATTGTFTFGTLHISTGNEPALAISGAGTVRVTDPSSTLASSLSAAIDVFSVELDMTFASVSSSSFSNVGIRLINTTGDLTMSGGTITSTLGSSIRITGGSTNVSYAGSIASTRSNDVVAIQNTTGGTMTFSGPITAPCDTCSVSTNAGINLNNNTGATINFSGGLTLATGPNTGFSATGGGTVNVTGTNTINNTTGTGININNTTIGASGVTFESVSVSGAPNGIVLTNTGSGAFAVTGTGAASSGGSILNTTGTGIDISGSTAGSTFTFTSLDINNSTTAGVSLSGTSGTFALQSSTVINSGNFLFAGVDLLDHVGFATISNSTVSGSSQNNVDVHNDVGPLALTVTGSTFSTSSSKGGVGLDIQTGTSASTTANVTGSTFNINSLGLGGFAKGSSTLDLTVNGINAFTSNGDGIFLGNNGGGTLTFDVMGNGFTGNSFSAVNVQGSGPGGLLSGSITGNTMVGPSFSRGIDMFFNGGADAIVRTFGNDMSDHQHGVLVFLGSSPSDNSTLDLTIETEIISLPLAVTPGIDVTTKESTTLCTNIRSNTIMVGDANAIELRQNDLSTVSIEGLNGGMGSVSVSVDVAAFLQSVNPLSPAGAFVTIAPLMSILGVMPGDCRTP